MATRLYYDNNVAAASWPTESAVWDQVATAPVRRMLDRARWGPGGTTYTATQAETTATAPWDVMLAQHVSKPLNGDQTISGTFRAIARIMESSGSANFISQAVIRVFSGDMTTERGVIFAGNTQTSATVGEWSTAQAGYSLVNVGNGVALPDTSISDINALDGDVIVVEIGYRSTNTVTTSYSGSAYFFNSQNVTAYPDYAAVSATTSGAIGWIEFSQDLVFEGDYALGTTDGIEAPVDLTGTMTTPIGLSFAGSMDINVGLDGTLSTVNRSITLQGFKDMVLATSPWGYWPMDDGSGTTVADISGNGRDATITNGSWVDTTITNSYGEWAVGFDNVIGNVRHTGTVPVATPATSGTGFTYMVVMRYGVSTSATFEHGTHSGDAFRAQGGTTAYLYASGTGTGDRLTLIKPPLDVYRVWIYRYQTSGNVLTQFISGFQVASRTVFTFTTDGTYMGAGNTSATYEAFYQHMAYWDKALTDEEIEDLGSVFLIEPTFLSIDGALDAEVGLEASLTVSVPFDGAMDAEVGLEATLSESHPLVGEIDAEVALEGTALFNTALQGEIDAEVSLLGLITVQANDLALEGSVDVDVSLEATPTYTTFYALAGEIDIEVDLFGDSFEESFRAGTLDIPVDLTGTATITTYVDPASALITLSASTETDPSIYLIAEPYTVLQSFTAKVSLAYVAPLPVPSVPESASPTNPATATGLVLRPMSGIIVDMDTPTIEDGLPQ